ncbi:M23 family metallopeptidase, partial [Candidatus Uhrbacteria bacterium]|nr:M23 family metallopeptidase [Candidatus Uhrbacteria bacterium]
ILKEPLLVVGRILYAILLGIYKIYWKLALKIKAQLTPVHQSISIKTIQKSFIHVIMLGMALVVVTHNLQASPITTNFGQSALLSSIVSSENQDSEVITEEAANVNQPIKHFNENAVSALPQIDEQPQQPASPDFASTTSGGSALIKPSFGSEVLTPKNRLRDTIEEYIVSDGDTIASIADNYGVTVNTILWENNLTTRSVIQPGQKLAILPTSGVSHTVKTGESLTKIAKLYNIDEDQILIFNELASANQLQVGQKLIIPDGELLRAAPPVVAPKTHLAQLKDIFTPPLVVQPKDKLFWPTPSHAINQYFTWRHSGLDIDGNFTSPIFASDPGTVVEAGWNRGGYGIQVIIDHGNGLKTRYAHLSKLIVAVGDQVTRGQTLGIMGSTGNSTGTHLHFEVMSNSIRRNPLLYLR